MNLTLGNKFNRNYNLRIPFTSGYYNVGIFFDKRSAFVLFGMDREEGHDAISTNISMYKNLESSKFCETFIKLHNYRKNTLDIVNQFSGIEPQYTNDIVYNFNETMILSKINIDNRELFDQLTVYGLTMNLHSDDFIFIIAERQNINQKLRKKFVRTTGVQIATAASIKTLEEYYIEHQTSGKAGTEKRYVAKDAVIKLED
jgi:hypothetical protein